jgi:hypothetical protein
VNRDDDDDDERSFDGTPEVVMTPSDVNDFAASALEKHGPRAGRRRVEVCSGGDYFELDDVGVAFRGNRDPLLGGGFEISENRFPAIFESLLARVAVRRKEPERGDVRHPHAIIRVPLEYHFEPPHRSRRCDDAHLRRAGCLKIQFDYHRARRGPRSTASGIGSRTATVPCERV